MLHIIKADKLILNFLIPINPSPNSCQTLATTLLHQIWLSSLAMTLSIMSLSSMSLPGHFTYMYRHLSKSKTWRLVSSLMLPATLTDHETLRSWRVSKFEHYEIAKIQGEKYNSKYKAIWKTCHNSIIKPSPVPFDISWYGFKCLGHFHTHWAEPRGN